MRIRMSRGCRAPLYIRRRLLRRECFRNGGLQVGVGQSLSSAFSLLFFSVPEGIALFDCLARLLAVFASYLWLFVGAWASIRAFACSATAVVAFACTVGFTAAGILIALCRRLAARLQRLEVAHVAMLRVS